MSGDVNCVSTGALDHILGLYEQEGDAKVIQLSDSVSSSVCFCYFFIVSLLFVSFSRTFDVLREMPTKKGNEWALALYETKTDTDKALPAREIIDHLDEVSGRRPT